MSAAQKLNPSHRGVKGEIYACKPDIFAATYEAVPLKNRAALAATEPR